ncbi:flagellar hook-length control protein FliK [Pseudomonas sp. B6002]|uniref:type III secretion system HrpP C-terminal domain-containing protein n=1 Tax=Pseudomonas sp. B6002 TaxID=2726978 RepID=UPI0015A2DA19|nr:flagellar hook-length control protein FliK [Pseudomonas sp. B6002]
MKQISNKPTEYPRLREIREDREPIGAGVVPWEQGRLFAQLFAGRDDGAGRGPSLLKAKPIADATLIGALTDLLLPRMQMGAQWPLQAVLYLPRLGRINASVRREQGAWAIELEPEQDATARWLSGVRQRCEGRLAAALGLPVSLHLPCIRLT